MAVPSSYARPRSYTAATQSPWSPPKQRMSFRRNVKSRKAGLHQIGRVRTQQRYDLWPPLARSIRGNGGAELSPLLIHFYV
jgi:hypothetical protein